MAEKTSALSVNGVYLGIVDGFERTCELNPEERAFCEIKPTEHTPVSFTFDEAFLFSPPPQIKLYYTRNGVAIYACNFVRADPAMHVIWQKKLNGILMTLYVQGTLQLSFESEKGFQLIPLPDSLQDALPTALGSGILLEGERAFAHLSREGKVLVLSEGKVLEKEHELRAEVPFHDAAGHTALCSWKEGSLTACSIRARREPQPDTFALALFESVLIGADPVPYLHETLLEKAELLKEFLGKFISVVLTGAQDEIGLVYERKKNVYDVKYFRVELTEGKISNITPL